MKNPKMININEEKCVGCLSCQLACSFNKNDRFNIFDSFIDVDWSPENPIIRFMDECDECLQCVLNCFYGCLTIAEMEEI